MKYLIFALFLLIGCSSSAPPVPVPKPNRCYKRMHTVLHADSSFSGPERREIMMGAIDWYELSHGQVELDIVFDREPGVHSDVDSLWRAKPEDLNVLAVEGKHARIRKLPSFTVFGYTNLNPVEVVLVVERVPLFQLRHLAGHEFGHAIGLRWPNCVIDSKNECTHTKDPDALMNIEFTNKDLGPGDLEFCRASCLCP